MEFPLTNTQALLLLLDRAYLIMDKSDGGMKRIGVVKDFPDPGMQLLDDTGYTVLSSDEVEAAQWCLRTSGAGLQIVARIRSGERGSWRTWKGTVYMSPTSPTVIKTQIIAQLR